MGHRLLFQAPSHSGHPRGTRWLPDGCLLPSAYVGCILSSCCWFSPVIPVLRMPEPPLLPSGHVFLLPMARPPSSPWPFLPPPYGHAFHWGGGRCCSLIRAFWGLSLGSSVIGKYPSLLCKSNGDAPKGPAWLFVHLQDGEIDLKLLTKVLAPEHEVREVRYLSHPAPGGPPTLACNFLDRVGSWLEGKFFFLFLLPSNLHLRRMM